jgi:hypothetical protein
MEDTTMRTKALLALCGVLALLTVVRAQNQPPPAPSWPQVVQVVTRMASADSLTDVQWTLRENASVVMHEATDSMIGAALGRGGLTQQETLILNLAQETFRDARAEGLELAAATLGVRVTLLELIAAQTPADARAVLVKRRDVTTSPQLAAAFARVSKQPDANPRTMQEIATAFREANTSLDAAVLRLSRLAASAAPAAPASPAGAPSQTAGASSSTLAGHWRCTTSRGGGPSLTMTTDHHMVLNDDGTYRTWQHTVTVTSFSGSENTTPVETGRWSARGSVLVLTATGGSTMEIPFQRSGDTIVLPNESVRRVWERVR